MSKEPKKRKRYHYQSDWEKLEVFQGWLEKTPDNLLEAGEPEARCKVSKCCLRAHKKDLEDHVTTRKHKQNIAAIPTIKSNRQGTLLPHGFKSKTSESKVSDMKLSAHIACHSSVRTIDHLGEMLKSIAHGSKLANLKLHRTKCSKIICKVLAPSMLKELIQDVGDSWYSLIIDESTDTTALKHLAVLVRYYSFPQKCMITELLGLVETPQATAQILYEGLKGLLEKVGLKLNHLLALGTDGGLILCGSNNSVYALLKKYDCPNFHLVKCICHGLDKCASKASEAFPPTLEFLVRKSRNWFSHSALRKFQYEQEYKALTDGQKPPQLVRLAATRWLAWDGAVKSHSMQYDQLKHLFRKVANQTTEEKCPMAHQLAQLHEDGSNLLYLTFLRPILRDMTALNVAFQSSNADVSRLYTYLRAFILAIAGSFIKPEALKQGQPGMLRLSELQALQLALQKRDSFKSLALIDYGAKFWQAAAQIKLPDEQLKQVQQHCADFLFKFSSELVKRLPSCMDSVQKLRAFAPSAVFAARGRPEFRTLPLDIIKDPTIDIELMESEWKRLGTLIIGDVCTGEEDAAAVDMTKFWASVWDLKTAGGARAFPNLARYVLAALSLPVSNAVVERIFSVLGIIKTKLRNRLGMEMLEAMLRIRTHFQAVGKCCVDFEPTQFMIDNFNYKTMYHSKNQSCRAAARAREGGDDEDCFLADDPDAIDNIPVGFPAQVDIDGDEGARAIPEWEEMMDLLAQVDALTDLTICP